MSSQTGVYRDRRKQRRLHAAEKQLERIRSELSCGYTETPEMIFLEKDIRWHDISQLIFYMTLRNVNRRWDGLRDYGFIRLCAAWIERRDIHEISREQAFQMLEEVLPESMCTEIHEEIEALELL